MREMNTPRTQRSKGGVSLYRKGDRNGKVDRVENDAVSSTATITAASSPMLNVGVDNDAGGAIGGLSPLIPDDDDNNDDEDTIPNTWPKFQRSVSIGVHTNDATKGVECCDNDITKWVHHIGWQRQRPQTDEEENSLLLDEIHKDVIRTHPDLCFFLEPQEDLGQKRYAALERILYVGAKLNNGVRYVQGMNEIVGTLYFVLAHDTNEDWSNEAKADTYFLFNALLVEMRDVFVLDLDEADTGIHGRISNMITLLSLHDPEVRCHLDSVGIDPSFYVVRWLTTLLSREFLLPDTIRLWDSMFVSTHNTFYGM
jgi:hypothetical protein